MKMILGLKCGKCNKALVYLRCRPADEFVTAINGYVVCPRCGTPTQDLSSDDIKYFDYNTGKMIPENLQNDL